RHLHRKLFIGYGSGRWRRRRGATRRQRQSSHECDRDPGHNPVRSTWTRLPDPQAFHGLVSRGRVDCRQRAPDCVHKDSLAGVHHRGIGHQIPGEPLEHVPADRLGPDGSLLLTSRRRTRGPAAMVQRGGAVPSRLPAGIPEQLGRWGAEGDEAKAIFPTDGTSFAAVEVDRVACSGCGLCARFCPTGALTSSDAG
ncbi:MAG: 4Fe-4S binding protein, partial [Acidimicrobiia bacterium]|nr:4Fe-4S binding protein [Acidimicrobiia bacterium]